ncbi:putative phosphatidate phosphatase [Pararge aegeria]|uniref:Jg5905 protein n=2 Tax=Pararge aegeria TaxID=116150 RepID=A0A8S4RF59_9NEOP|nr:putative phosphatidate phosphatase [Pararge aegeria]CAH2235335.1 jg5905 [Pararge aegeria aegeria]
MAFDRLILKIVLDLLVLACVGVPLLVIHLVAEPYHRGYFANDLSLMLPYKPQTISEGLLAGVGFAINVVTIIIVEIVRNKQGRGLGDKFLFGNLISGWIWETYTSIGVFTFGAACQQLTVNSAKYVIGRLRPHFFDICQPVPNASPTLNALGYIQDFTCAGPNADVARLKDMRLSFPSAHSSFAMYSAVFFIFYIQVKGKWRGSKLLRHGIQFAMLIGAWYVGLSRVVDHMHHWSDVAVGFAVGALYGVIVFIFVLKPKKYGAPASWETGPPEMLPRPVLSR